MSVRTPARPRSTARMERQLLERDEEPLAELVARKIADMGTCGARREA